MSEMPPPWADAPYLPDIAPPLPARFKKADKPRPSLGRLVAVGEIIDHACRWCEHKECYVSPGKAMHAAGITCNGCGRHQRWLRRDEVLT